MGRLEDLALHNASLARHELSEALNRIVCLDDEGTLRDKDLGRIAYAYHRMSWWQQVTDLTHGCEETVDGATAILIVRQRAQELLINARPLVNGGLFALAMAESRRGGARAFLDATQTLADALTPPPGRDAEPVNATTAHAMPAGAEHAAAVKEYRP
ncbi:hypothetical protein [Nonomuraea pusilla]|uniref:Uncharacterized protein n=1 Tax=Nonomuraea pusilla TaxID=46177 RepID=A0A1H8JEV2_9ACTN|nr:hypothetical protein [Nonomuraea pusilla]SEN78737.1 hypothetical protein SAMN05660976_08315 [Nonomuraea pusilla]